MTQEEQKQNLILLKNYLVNDLIKYNKLNKQQAEAMTEEIIYKCKDNIFGYKGLAHDLGKRNIEFFCKYFLGDVFTVKENNTARELAKVHYDIWNELQQMIAEDKWDMEEFILSRGVAKTTVINKALVTYVSCYRISRYSLVIGKTEQDASNFIDDIKKFMEFEPIKLAFGKLINKKDRTVNQQELELDNDVMIRSYGWGTSVRGTSYSAPDGIFRPMLTICDDILNENDIKTENAKENAINKFYKEILEVGDEAVIRNGKKIKMASKFIICGTPLAQDCFINTIRKDPNFRVFRRAVVDFNIDNYFEDNEYWQHFRKILLNTKIKDDERDLMLRDYYLDNIEHMKFPTIWEKYDCFKLAKKYFTKRTAFLQELMCDCENVGEKWFKSMRKMSSEEIESNKFIKTILCCDPASTVTKRSDYTALCVGSLAENGFKYVRKGIIDKLSFDDYCNKVVELLRDWKQISHVLIEKNTYNSADLIKIKELVSKDNELSSRNIEFINKHQTKNKNQKIESIIDAVNSGQIIFNQEDEEFNNQFIEFSGCETSLHDDSNDVVSEFVINIDTIEEKKYLKFDTSFIL